MGGLGSVQASLINCSGELMAAWQKLPSNADKNLRCEHESTDAQEFAAEGWGISSLEIDTSSYVQTRHHASVDLCAHLKFASGI